MNTGTTSNVGPTRHVLSPVHIGDYSRRKRRQFVEIVA